MDRSLLVVVGLANPLTESKDTGLVDLALLSLFLLGASLGVEGYHFRIGSGDCGWSLVPSGGIYYFGKHVAIRVSIDAVHDTLILLIELVIVFLDV